MYYELVNLNSGNRIGEFDTEGEALRDVQDVIQRRGKPVIAGIALVQVDDQGNVSVIAEGAELAEHAAAVLA